MMVYDVGLIEGSCKDCKNRFDGCHDTCKKYLDYKKRNDEIRAKVRKKKLFDSWQRREK